LRLLRGSERLLKEKALAFLLSGQWSYLVNSYKADTTPLSIIAWQKAKN